MIFFRRVVPVVLSCGVAAAFGCSSEPASPGSGGAGGGAGAATGGVNSGGTSGMPATGGVTTTAGAATTGGGGQTTAGGAAMAGTGGMSAGGSSNLGHGSAAKNLCPAGMTYGDPLMGMGSVTTISAPPSDYFAFIEGPVWIGSLKTLFFSDNASSPTERVFKLVPPSTTPAVLIPASGSNGLAVDNNDRLVAADQRNRQIVRFDPMTGQIVGTPTTTGTAKPNDVLVRSDDNIYYTDPDTGFYRLSPGAASVSEPMKLTPATRPNGIALSLDENTLYVGDVGGMTIAKYALMPNGSVMSASGTAFVAKTMHDTVDGLCVDCAGNVYASTSNGVEVYSSAGTYIGTVPTGESSNCTFGGDDRKTLYVTSRAVLKAVTLAVPGLPD